MVHAKKKKRVTPISPVTTAMLSASLVFMASGLTILLWTFLPAIIEELRYAWRHTPVAKVTAPAPMTPIDADFDIIIPKLGANARIIKDVDPYDAKAYQYALSRGVAHAKGTGLPGENANVFLFSHSSENFYEATRYNSVFYLINKLEKGDEIDLWFNGVKFVYLVTEKKFVGAKNTSYLTRKPGSAIVTLMTCWPPGTTFQRLLVFAQLKK